MGCAMAIEAIRRYREPETQAMVAAASGHLATALHSLADLPSVKNIRGEGLMMGVETVSGERALQAVKGLLQDGILALPDGPDGDVVAFTPPFCVSREEIDFAVGKLRARLA
jgi:4-aminobutyrate aminotransferase/(S)-3-amino-2-methylpropionate transaminase